MRAEIVVGRLGWDDAWSWSEDTGEAVEESPVTRTRVRLAAPVEVLEDLLDWWAYTGWCPDSVDRSTREASRRNWKAAATQLSAQTGKVYRNRFG